MKVLHLVAGQMTGGATRGAYWLHEALRSLGIDSRLLTNSKDSFGDESVISLADSAIGKLKFGILKRMGQAPAKAYPKRKRVIFNTGFEGVDFTRHPAYAAADLVHLHWVNGLVSTRVLRKVRKPVIWTLRDMWPFTGGCHYSMDCEQFMQGCGKCPQLGSSRESDLSRFIVRHKRASVPKDIRIVGISRWLADCAGRSSVFRGCQVQMISNNVDTGLFSPFPKDQARQALGLDVGRNVVLIGAGNIADFYKGFDLFLEALKSLSKENVHIVVFGKCSESDLDSLGLQCTNLGYLSDSEALRMAYSAADVFVAPSRMDAFGKTLVEAMLCGTPAVAFNATGPKDIVEHRTTGYLAEPFNPQDLARGIRWVLEQASGVYAETCRNAQAQARQRFDSRVIAQQYVELYREVMHSAKA